MVRKIFYRFIAVMMVGLFSILGMSFSLSASQGADSAKAGHKIFKSKCAMCHTVGKGKKLGPDLKGVTDLRKKEWLVKFLSDPPSMLKKDPEAKALLKKYKIPMPNFKLKEEQIQSILAYLEETSSKKEKKKKKEVSEKKEVSSAEGIKAGHKTFKSKCAACHTIGKGKRVGPDLKGVTDSRKKEWLKKFISDPPSMLKNDPEAKALLKKYKIPMPKMGLSSEQIETLLLFLQSE